MIQRTCALCLDGQRTVGNTTKDYRRQRTFSPSVQILICHHTAFNQVIPKGIHLLLAFGEELGSLCICNVLGSAAVFLCT